jgi:hypothetical protein
MVVAAGRTVPERVAAAVEVAVSAVAALARRP